jgi:uncharacterized protein (TIGR03437 family)
MSHPTLREIPVFTFWRTSLVVVALCCVAEAQQSRRTFAITQSHYSVRAGERVEISSSADTVAFARSAKSLTARASGHMIRNFAVGPTPEGDKLLLGIPLTTEPGDYLVEVSLSGENEERSATLQVHVEPLSTPTANSSEPPFVLLDGFQLSASSCPMSSNSSGNFGNLQAYLQGSPNNVPGFFFENCTECPNCSIEQLGADLATFLNLLPYSQVDVVAHSMGGLIVRSYLAGKQANGFSPPPSPKIRKAVFIATPHFGAFAADFLLADILLAAGTQTNELKPASQFVWDLGTWTQLGDDLRGVDAIALVGTAGPSGQSDGVVESTSASLDFSMTGRTRIVNYCHVPPSTADGLAGPYLQCTAPGIAYVDTPAHPAYVAVSSFLLSGTAWQGVGNAPAQDAYLSKYGGLVVADINSSNQYVVPSAVSWGTVKLAEGGASELYYNDFVSGSATFNFGASTCGPYTETAGRYSTVRCKAAPSIYSVGPLLPGTARVVHAGGTITISGTGFGATQCSICRVVAENPAATNLQVLSWSDSTITGTLPASFGVGIVTIAVTSASGSDAMNVMAGMVVQPPAISLSSSSLNFAVSVGSSAPGVQNITVSNSGGGALSYSVTSNASWLSATASGSIIAVSVNPAGLAANTYQGLITVTAAGASNSPQSVSVSMVVTGTLSPILTISSITNSGTGLEGPIAPGELFTIMGKNLGPTTGTVFSVNNGTVSGTLAGTTVTVGSIAAPVLYTSTTQINAIAPYEISGQSQVTVQVVYQGTAATQAVPVQSASPGAFTLNSAGTGGVVAANQDGTINGPNNPAAKGSYVTIYFTGGGQTNPAGVTGSVTGSVLKWLTQPITVTVGNQPATVGFDGSAPTFVDGVDQLNIQLSPNTPSGAQPIIINVGGFSSPSTVTLAVQ